MNRILLIGSDFYDDTSANGVCLRNLAWEMTARGDRVCVLTESDGDGLLASEGGLEVHGVKRPFFSSFLAAHENKQGLHKPLVLLARILRGALVTLRYPNVSAGRSRKVLAAAKRLIDENDIGIVVGAYRPYESLWAAMRLKKAFPSLRVITYHLDLLTSPNTSSALLGGYKRRRGERALRRELVVVDRVILPESARGRLSDGKIRYADFPLYVTDSDEIPCAFRYDSDAIHIAYVGSLDKSNRNPEGILSAVDALPLIGGRRVEVHFWGRLSDPETVDCIERHPCAFYHGTVRHEETFSLLRQSDFLLNVGNRVTYEMIPSKIFQLFSVGKPIVNAVQHPDDRSLPYFRRCPCACNLDAADGNVDAGELAAFLEAFYRKDIVPDDTLYEESKPSYTVSLITEPHKLTVAAVNGSNFGSTGNIMLEIAETARLHGHSALTCCPKSRSNEKKQPPCQYLFGDIFTRNLHLTLGYLTGLGGCFSVLATLRLLRRLDREQVSLLHLHNLHNGFINLPLLFGYIKRKRLRVVWTLHDCWAFTGQCPYFDMAGCSKWRTGCHDCPRLAQYPPAKTDRTKTMWRLKKKWFTGVKHLTVVTPSEWLAGLVKESFLQEYPVRVIHNGIDLNVFRPSPSDFREKHGISPDEFLLLGVAFDWDARKGLDAFLTLAERLGDSFRIVLVGTNDDIDAQLPERVISIHKTHDRQEMAEIYTAADLFVNPTLEENYPTVNMEAIACGTPVLTFRTGGSPEIPDKSTGAVVARGDVGALAEAIESIRAKRPFTEEACLRRAREFDSRRKYEEYIALYEQEDVSC